MTSALPSFDEVKAGLGDKVVGSVSLSVADAKERLATYRRVLPDHASEHTARGLAGMVNDWMWASMKRSLESVGTATINDSEPLRELGVGLQYRIRLKRHREGRVSSYPTESFLDFQTQGTQLAFDGMTEVRLNAGYRWDHETRSIEEPVLSLFHRDNLIWCESLAVVEADLPAIASMVEGGPEMPAIEFDEGDDEATGSDDVR